MIHTFTGGAVGGAARRDHDGDAGVRGSDAAAVTEHPAHWVSSVSVDATSSVPAHMRTP
jgi:hypothetical protein